MTAAADRLLTDPAALERERRALRLIGFAFLRTCRLHHRPGCFHPDLRRAPGARAARDRMDRRHLRGDAGAGGGQGAHRPSARQAHPETESRVALIDAYLAAAVLGGLLLNAALGWWWADPLAGLVALIYGLREATEALG